MTRPRRSTNCVAPARRSRLVFGSRARGDGRPDSDLDVGAWWPVDPPAAWDVELPDGVDLVVLNGAPLELAGRISIEGEILFDDDPPERVRWVATTRKIWLDENLGSIEPTASFWRLSSVVDEGRLSRLLRHVRDRATRLQAAAATPRGRPPRAVARRRQVPLRDGDRGCVDVAQHIASAERYPAPDTNSAAIRLLGERGVIDEGLAGSMSRSVGFRNVLVRQYTEVDDRIVLASLGDVHHLHDFVQAVSTWLLDQP